MGSPTQRKGWLTLAAVVGLLCAVAPSLTAQAGTIRGRVLEASNQTPLSGATVSIAGTQRRTVTNAQGEYSLTEVPAGRVTVRATQLGHQTAENTVTLAAGQTASANFALATTSVSLDAIVVTGTPGATSRRQIPNSITKLDVAEITERTTVGDVTEVLQGRTPGVQILSNSGTPGAAADIRVRGAGSLTAVRPVVYVDGIRYSDTDLGNFGASGGAVTSFSTQVTSALSFLNPEDIESIEVIKGPAAATLYGAEAAGGVIQVITKKGSRGAQRTQWSAKVEYGQNEMRQDLPDNFTVCTTARIAERVSTTDNRPRFPACQGQAVGTVIREESPLLNDPFGLRDGEVRRLNLSVRGGGDRFSYFVSGDTDDDEGVFFNSFNNRRSVRANFTATANNRLDFQFSTNYVRNHLRLPIGDESAQGLLFLSVRGIPGRFTGFENVFPGYPGTVGGLQANEYNNQTRSDRFTLGATANYRPLDWFRNRVTVGADVTAGLAEILSTPGSTDASFGEVPEGIVAQRVPRERFYTVDYVGTAELPVASWLESRTSFGVNYIARRRETITGTGRGLGAPDITTIQSAAFSSSTNAFTENASIGYYVQEELGFNNRLFLTGALRADDNSSFGEDFDVIVYPKLGFSWVLSEEPALENFFGRFAANQFKIRGAYGQAGRAPDPYSANQTYTVVKVTQPTATGTGVTTVNGIRSVGFGNPNLEAERGEEYELGFETGFFENRIGIDFTYYNKRTDNLLQSVAISPSLGFTGGQLTNLGSIRNTGVELLFNVIPVQTRRFTWDSRLNLSTNKNELLSFGVPGRIRADAAFQAYGTVQEHRVGHPIAGFWVRKQVVDSAGNPRFNAANLPVVDTAFTYVGQPTPAREIGFGNTFTLFGNVSVFAQLDYKGGFKVYNRKEFDRCRAAVANCERIADIRYFEPANAADTAFVRETNVYRGNAVTITGTTLTNAFFDPYIEDGDFVKLRDLSVSVGLPRSLIARTGASGATFTLAGRNLATLWTKYSGIDPEANTYGNRSFVRVDAYAAPQNRRVTAAINVNF